MYNFTHNEEKEMKTKPSRVALFTSMTVKKQLIKRNLSSLGEIFPDLDQVFTVYVTAPHFFLPCSRS